LATAGSKQSRAIAELLFPYQRNVPRVRTVKGGLLLKEAQP
jgi:hypothetical protein